MYYISFLPSLTKDHKVMPSMCGVIFIGAQTGKAVPQVMPVFTIMKKNARVIQAYQSS